MQESDIKEKRRYKRLPIKVQLNVDEIFKQDNITIKNVGASLNVFDISRSGIGFISTASLPIGYYFQGLIHLGDEDFFRVVIQIVRSDNISEQYKVYGAEFVGLAAFLAEKVDKYEKKLRKETEPIMKI